MFPLTFIVSQYVTYTTMCIYIFIVYIFDVIREIIPAQPPAQPCLSYLIPYSPHKVTTYSLYKYNSSSSEYEEVYAKIFRVTGV